MFANSNNQPAAASKAGKIEDRSILQHITAKMSSFGSQFTCHLRLCRRKLIKVCVFELYELYRSVKFCGLSFTAPITNTEKLPFLYMYIIFSGENPPIKSNQHPEEVYQAGMEIREGDLWRRRDDLKIIHTAEIFSN